MRVPCWTLACAVALAVPHSASAQQGPQALSVQAYGGFGNGPAGFDAYRQDSFNSGVRFGGGLTLGFSEYLSLRFDAATVSNSGTDTTLGAIDQPVSFRRSYFSAALQLSYASDMKLTPYVLLGGGFVRLSRSASEYWYGLTQFSALVGVGASYPLGRQLSLLVEGTGWLYQRETAGGSQFDSAVDIGFSYNLAR